MIEDTYYYNSVEVAKYIVACANEQKFGINMTKLQKLLYITYGANLVVNQCRLTDEHPQAWPYGPVFPKTRSKFLKVDLSTISKDDKDLIKLTKDENLNQLIDFVFEGFGKWTAQRLTAWSHKEGSPWSLTTKLDWFKWGSKIPDQYILNYFNSLIKVNV